MFSSHCSPAAKWHECETTFFFSLLFFNADVSAGINIRCFVVHLMRIADYTLDEYVFSDRIFWSRWKSIKSTDPIRMFCVTTACTSIDVSEGSGNESRLLRLRTMRCNRYTRSAKQCVRFTSFRLCRAHCLPDRLPSMECIICLISNYIVSKCQRYPSPMRMTWIKLCHENSIACITVVFVSHACMRLSAILIDTLSVSGVFSCQSIQCACDCMCVRGIEARPYLASYRHRDRWHNFGFAQSVQKIKGPFCRQTWCRIAIHSHDKAT